MITLHIIAVGHQLLMVVTMFNSKKEKNIYGDYAVGQLFRIFFRKKEKHLWKLCCGSAMSQLLHGNIIHSIQRYLGVDSICVNQEKHQSKQD